MAKVLKFTLSGKNAFFKKPDVNTYLYFTYGHIHKVALLGLLGAIAGYDGYGQKDWKKPKNNEYAEEYPEFYEKLRNTKVAIVPTDGHENLPKSIHSFNNSVGYASKEDGGNLIVKEQWLENPSWDIYIMQDSEESKKVSDNIKNSNAVYIPYLGKNDHMADISNVEEIDAEKADLIGKSVNIKGLFPRNTGILVFSKTGEDGYKYEERLPISLDGMLNKYETRPFVLTNMKVDIKNDESLYNTEYGVVAFF